MKSNMKTEIVFVIINSIRRNICFILLSGFLLKIIFLTSIRLSGKHKHKDVDLEKSNAPNNIFTGCDNLLS